MTFIVSGSCNTRAEGNLQQVAVTGIGLQSQLFFCGGVVHSQFRIGSVDQHIAVLACLQIQLAECIPAITIFGQVSDGIGKAVGLGMESSGSKKGGRKKNGG